MVAKADLSDESRRLSSEVLKTPLNYGSKMRLKNIINVYRDIKAGKTLDEIIKSRPEISRRKIREYYQIALHLDEDTIARLNSLVQ